MLKSCKDKTSPFNLFPTINLIFFSGHDYYVKLLGRLVQSVQGKMPFPYMDWRFNEFPNEGAHALYVTSVEIMGLPNLDPVQVRETVWFDVNV